MCRRCVARSSWLSVEQLPHRRERVAGPGDHVEQHRVADPEAGGQRLGLGGDQPLEGLLAPADEPLGRLLAHHLAPLLRVVARLGQRPLVLDRRARAPAPRRCPTVSNPARPARPAIWWNSRACSSRDPLPSYLDSAVNSTVRIGTLTPTPRVSVPQMTFSSPACASVSTSRRYLGSMPGVVHADAVPDVAATGCGRTWW